jgi:hypothetical protein
VGATGCRNAVLPTWARLKVVLKYGCRGETAGRASSHGAPALPGTPAAQARTQPPMQPWRCFKRGCWRHCCLRGGQVWCCDVLPGGLGGCAARRVDAGWGWGWVPGGPPPLPPSTLGFGHHSVNPAGWFVLLAVAHMWSCAQLECNSKRGQWQWAPHTRRPGPPLTVRRCRGRVRQCVLLVSGRHVQVMQGPVSTPTWARHSHPSIFGHARLAAAVSRVCPHPLLRCPLILACPQRTWNVWDRGQAPFLECQMK